MAIKEIYDPTNYVNIKKKDGKIIKRASAWAENNPSLLKHFGWTVDGSVKEKPKSKTEVKPKKRKKKVSKK